MPEVTLVLDPMIEHFQWGAADGWSGRASSLSPARGKPCVVPSDADEDTYRTTYSGTAREKCFV